MVVAQVRRTLTERRLFGPRDHVLVACSFGPDSVALAHILSLLADSAGFRISLATVDHGLRPEAAAEVLGVRALAERLGVPFHAVRVKVSPTGPSLQAAARRARYAALHGIAARAGAGRLATGHTKDDQAETVVARLTRGAGIRGLSGIAPRRQDGVVRPLIDCLRRDLLDHLARHGLPHAADPSNKDDRYGRVRIRRTLLPALAAEDPRIIHHLASLADDARAMSRFVRSEARALIAPRSGGPVPPSLRVETLAQEPEPVRRAALQLWLEEVTGLRAGRAHLDALDRALTRGSAEVLLPDGVRVDVAEGRLHAKKDARPRRVPRAPRGGENRKNIEERGHLC